MMHPVPRPKSEMLQVKVVGVAPGEQSDYDVTYISHIYSQKQTSMDGPNRVVE